LLQKSKNETLSFRSSTKEQIKCFAPAELRFIPGNETVAISHRKKLKKKENSFSES
jgi:hypothetical protein